MVYNRVTEDEKMEIGYLIKKERLRNNLSQEEVAKAIDSTKQAVYKYENGIVTNIPMDKIEKMAQLFGVSPAYLMGWEEKSAPQLDLQLFAEARPVHRKRLQMLGNVACGEPIFAEAEQDSMIDADTDADFCLTAKGDSMINARIFDGDLLFVKQCDIVDDGEIAVVLIGDEATVKRFYYDRENNVVTLMPENPLYKPMRYVGADLDTIRVLGRVVAGQYKL
jgi:repressor LexA